MFTEKLFEKLNEIVTLYPDGIIPVPEIRIEGTAFFPAGDGLYNPKKFPKGGIMILGQDFDNEVYFIKSRKEKLETNNKTWHNLLEILKHTDISPEDCFFTNAIMGLRKGDTTRLGKSKAFIKENKEFLKKCQVFFLEQVKFQKPRLIIGLGSHMPMFLSGTSEKLKDISKIKSLSKLGNTKEENIFKDVSFNSFDGYKTKIIFITHPAFYYANVGKRYGEEFEYELINAANK